MTEAPKPRLALVDRAMAEQPEASESKAAATRLVLTKHAPTIARLVRAEERASIFGAAGAQTIHEFSQLNQLRQERDARPTLAEEAKHGRHQRWMGFAIGIPVGAILACIAIFAMQGVIWDTAARSFREQAMTGALLSAQPDEQ